uniref:Uncharacterized protein n=1 Tax=Oryza glumipatula TaxID=40148 RepID=A0A0D9YVQ3_9ORYZ
MANTSAVTCFWPLAQTHHRLFGVGVERDKRDGKGWRRAGPSKGGSRGKIEEIVKKAVVLRSQGRRKASNKEGCAAMKDEERGRQAAERRTIDAGGGRRPVEWEEEN